MCVWLESNTHISLYLHLRADHRMTHHRESDLSFFVSEIGFDTVVNLCIASRFLEEIPQRGREKRNTLLTDVWFKDKDSTPRWRMATFNKFSSQKHPLWRAARRELIKKSQLTTWKKAVLKIFPIHYYFVFLTQGQRRSVNGMVFGLAGGDLDILHHSIADMNDPAFKKSHLFILICVTHRASWRSSLFLAGVLLCKDGRSGKETERGKPLEVRSIFTEIRYIHIPWLRWKGNEQIEPHSICN